MIGLSRLLALSLSCATVAGAQTPPTSPHESTAVYIRRLAGLPAATATGAISIDDVGHGPMDTMLSIVANRDGGRWRVSWVCAASPHCAPGNDHAVREAALSEADSRAVDAILDGLRTGEEPDGQRPSPAIIGGQLLVSIDDRGFRRDYRRVGQWGKVLGRLETLLTPPA